MDFSVNGDASAGFSGAENADSFQRRFGALVISSRKDRSVDGTLAAADGCPAMKDPRCRRRRPLPVAAAAAAVADSKSPFGSDRYKTELCRQFSEGGTCRYGDKCQFAHGPGDRRSVARHPKYKTTLCRTFHSSGFCPYGTRCHFVHGQIGSTAAAAVVMWRRGTLDSQVVAVDRQVSSCDSLMHSSISNSVRIHRLIETLMSNRLVNDSSCSIQDQTTTTCSSPSSVDIWSSSAHFRPSGSMESMSASPTLSCSDSPGSSPTSMLPDEDMWASLVSIIGVGL